MIAVVKVDLRNMSFALRQTEIRFLSGVNVNHHADPIMTRTTLCSQRQRPSEASAVFHLEVACLVNRLGAMI